MAELVDRPGLMLVVSFAGLLLAAMLGGDYQESGDVPLSVEILEAVVAH